MASESRTLLIVDDDNLVLTMLHDIFADSFPVLTAKNGNEAVELLQHHEVTAVLSDHVMPGLSGVEVLGECMRLQPHAVRILVTASEDVGAIRDAVNLARVHRVIAKPIHAVQVEGIVGGAIRERDLQIENERLVGELSTALAEVKEREAELERELQIRTRELREVMQRVKTRH
jgi:response regulator RpfG family c-di-GMP phosphodiesterase